MSNLLTGKSNGSALVITLGFLVLFILTTFSITSIMGNSSTLSVYHSVRTDALAMAEAGIDDARLEIKNADTWTAGFTNKTFGNGSYTVIIDTGVNYDTIISTGKMPGGNFIRSDVKRTVKYLVAKSGEKYTCTTSSYELTIKDNSSCIGNAYSKDKIELSSNGDILGNASAQDDINGVGGSNSITGTKNAANYTPVLPAITIPGHLAAATYKKQGQVGGTNGGDLTLDSTQSYGPKYITGDLEIKDGATITLTGTLYVKKEVKMEDATVKGKYVIYVEDGIEIKDDATVGAANDGPLIITPEDFVLEEDITVIDSILYSGKELKMKDVQMTGFVIGQKITMEENTDITLKEITGMDVTIPQSGGGGGTAPTIAWTSD